MTPITLPFWIFALAFGVPIFMFLCLVVSLLYKIRQPKRDHFTNISMQQLSRPQFHSDLLCSQIDTIFSGLNAIIETERLKIQALLNHGHINLPDDRRTPVEVNSLMVHKAPQPSRTAAQSFEQPFTMPGESDDRQVDAIQTSGLSQTEIDLAMTMGCPTDANQTRKLEAVA
ncbi:MAG: hypothetical protein PVI60_09240 [Desulfobacteraceae bacterium]|jgi:hypothetical protein